MSAKPTPGMSDIKTVVVKNATKSLDKRLLTIIEKKSQYIKR